VESVKIVLCSIVAAVLYGIVHDQFTARICLEYFTEFHPPVFATRSPTLLGIGWGIIATWWAGAIIGVLLATAARSGRRNKFTARQLVPSILRLLLLMGVSACLFGTIGYFWGSMPPEIADSLPVGMHRRFLADWWAHNASYASGFIGGIVFCAIIAVKRKRLSGTSFEASALP
jgi:membrane associated rhomboid family serine protease